jgi:hypothetical protein
MFFSISCNVVVVVVAVVDDDVESNRHNTRSRKVKLEVSQKSFFTTECQTDSRLKDWMVGIVFKTTDELFFFGK